MRQARFATVILILTTLVLQRGLQAQALPNAGNRKEVEAVSKLVDRLLTGDSAQKSESAVESGTAETTLFWGSGDSLTGELISADHRSLSWKSRLFRDPLQIELAALNSIRFPASTRPSSLQEPFRISMANGDVLFGQLVAATQETIQFQSQRHGEFHLLRKEVVSLKRIDTPDLVFLGPRGMEDWTKSSENQQGIAWRELSSGQLTTNSPDTGVFTQVDFPERCEIEIVIESSKTPSFILAFGQQRNSSLRVESWADALVVLSRFQFVEVDTLTADSHKLHLNMFLDQVEDRLSIYTKSGTKLAEIVDDRKFLKPTGIQLWNRDGDLTLSYLRIDRWNGELPKPLKIGQSRIQTTKGDVLYGSLPEFSAGTQSITIEHENGEQVLPIDQLANVMINDEQQSLQQPPGTTQVAWKEGEYLSGAMHFIKDGKISIQTTYSESPMESSLTGAQRVVLPNTAKIPENADQLFYQGGSLRGRLTIDHETEEPVRWSPIGGLNASALSNRGDARFVRNTEHAEPPIDVVEYPDVLYLMNGDVIPCKLDHVDEKFIRAAIPFSRTEQIPTTEVKAIEFSTAGDVSASGFTDAGWKRIAGRPVSTDKTLEFKHSGSFGHESIFTGDVLKFRLNWGPQQYSTLVLQLFGNRLGNAFDATNVLLHVNGDQLWVEEAMPAQQMQNVIVMQNGIPQGRNRSQVMRSASGTAEIMLAVRDGKVHVIIDNQLVKSIDLTNRKAKKRSLVIQANINSVTRNLTYGNNPLTRGMILNEFEVRNHDGTSAKQFIMEETRAKTLLIPRFRRDNPPTHVILAPNGDVLRGRLLEIDQHQIRFESQLEVFRFGRERIASIIWLHPETAEGSTEVTTTDETESSTPIDRSTEVQIQIGKRFQLSMTPETVADDRLIGHAANLGICSIPTAAIEELILGDPETRSGIVSYTQWIPRHAAEPNWDMPAEDGSGPAVELIGTKAADFALPGLDGETFRLQEHIGKVVVLDFWASWCGPCIAALPEFIDATAEFDPEKVIFVAVNLQESPQVVRNFLKENNMSPVVAIDETGGVANRFRVAGIPHTVILGPHQTIEQVRVGYRTQGGEELRETIKAILDGTWERPQPTASTAEPNTPEKNAIEQ